MKLKQTQILGGACAVLAVLLVATFLWAIAERSGIKRLELELAQLKDKVRTLEGKKPEEAPAARTDDASIVRLREALALAQRERDKLQRENNELKSAIARVQGGSGGDSDLLTVATSPTKPIPGSPLGSALEPGGPPPGDYPGGMPAPDMPPPIVAPPPAPRSEPWGASADTELDEMAAAIKLNKEQREQVKVIIVDGQNEFERRIIEAGAEGIRDIETIERIGNEISKRTEQRINQMLYAEQREAFRQYMHRLQGGE